MSSNNENLAIQRIAKLVDENSFMEIGCTQRRLRLCMTWQ